MHYTTRPWSLPPSSFRSHTPPFKKKMQTLRIVLLDFLFLDKTKSLLCCDAVGNRMWVQLHQNLQR
uniref:Uncharacterized protein n=1 Tax=Anguilla anguilla TaxID=7936 RepID=A0A0E9XEV4_ANGAN